jgi:ABC-type hemin transport system substrate-binding protein
MPPDVIIRSEKIWNGQPDPVAYHLLTPGLAETPARRARRFVTWPDTPTHRACWRLLEAARELAEKLSAAVR